MQLIDFRDCSTFNKLRKKMRNAEYITEFEIKSNIWTNPDLLDIIKKLKNEGIKFYDISDIEMGKDNSFFYKGQKIIIYIDDWNYDSFKGEFLNTYKFHIKSCQTIREYFKKNNLNRYVMASTRESGDFYINKKDHFSGKKENILHPIKVCKHCLNEINYKDYRNQSFRTKNSIYEDFDLKEFFKDNITEHDLKPRQDKGFDEKNTIEHDKEPKNNKPEVIEEITVNKQVNLKLVTIRDLVLIILELRKKINNKKILFKKTEMGNSIEGLLPTTIVTDQLNFGFWILNLNKYLIESSSGKNQIFPVVNYNSKNPDFHKYKIRDIIRILRNCVAAHDPQTGNYIEKNKADLLKIYRKYIGQEEPRDSEDWFDLQVLIYEDIKDWLNTVLKHL